MPIRVPLSAIVDGMEMQSDEMTSYLHRQTGRIVTVSDEAMLAAEADDEECVDDAEFAEARKLLDAESEYLALPDRFEIDEYRMMERFAAGLDDPEARDVVLGALRGRGAFRFFKDTVHRLGLADAWYTYRADSYLELARAWCESNAVEYDPQRPHA
jgi:hypothetical protein